MKKLPGVLSLQRGTIVSDGAFFSRFADGRLEPLPVIRHGIRGTQNVNVEVSTVTSSKSGRREVSNPQITDSAKIAVGADALHVRFGIRFMDLGSLLFACAPGKADAVEDIAIMRGAFDAFAMKAVEDGCTGLEEVSLRYARNIANARWLWRNRSVAESVKVTVEHDGKSIATFDALDIPLNDFSGYSDAEREVATVIAAGMRGNRRAQLSVSADVRFGMEGPVEVFPSQNYLKEKPKGFARPLYTIGEPEESKVEGSVLVMGQAALRDQKIGNALRTFDTWYPDAASHGGRPIPIEPNGASLESQVFFRNKKSSAFHHMLGLGSLDPNSEEGMFMLACLIRGGVYSGDSSKAPKEAG